MPSAADWEMKFYGDLGYTGSLIDRQRAYRIATDTLDPTRSAADIARAFWANNAIEASTANNTDLERRDYIGQSGSFTAKNSVTDLRWARYGGNP